MKKIILSIKTNLINQRGHLLSLSYKNPLILIVKVYENMRKRQKIPMSGKLYYVGKNLFTNQVI